MNTGINVSSMFAIVKGAVLEVRLILDDLSQLRSQKYGIGKFGHLGVSHTRGTLLGARYYKDYGIWGSIPRSETTN